MPIPNAGSEKKLGRGLLLSIGVRRVFASDVALLDAGDPTSDRGMLVWRRDELGLLGRSRLRLDDPDRWRWSCGEDRPDLTPALGGMRGEPGEPLDEESERVKEPFRLAAGMKVDVDLADPRWRDGELGAGSETTLGLSAAVRPAASSAAFAFLFSASSWLIAELAFLGALGLAVTGTTPFDSCGLAFSSCFLATPSISLIIAAACCCQTAWKLQYAARARSRTATFTSTRAFLIAVSIRSSRPFVESIVCRDRMPFESR